MKIRQALLGVVAGLALSGSALAHTAAKDSNAIAKNDIIAKTMEHVSLPKAVATDVFSGAHLHDSTFKMSEDISKIDTISNDFEYENAANLDMYHKAGDILGVPKTSIKIIDPDNGQDLTKNIQAIDSTIINDGGLDLNKVDSLEYVYEHKMEKPRQVEKYNKMLASSETDSVQRKNIQEKLSNNAINNEKRALLNQVAYPYIDVMVKTRSLEKEGRDLYQQAEMNFLGDIKNIPERGKSFLDTINPKISEVHTEYEYPMNLCEKAEAEKAMNLVAYSKSGEILSVPKTSIKIMDPDNGKDLTKDIKAIDSTIFQNGGLDLNKVDSLEYVYEHKMEKPSQVKKYNKMLANSKSSLDSVQRKNIQEKLSNNAINNEKRMLLMQVGHPHVDVMVKTRSLEKKGDLYQQADMNFLGDIEKITIKGKAFLDSINPKIPEAHTKFESPLCGKIGYATDKGLKIVANTCASDSTAVTPIVINKSVPDTLKTVAKTPVGPVFISKSAPKTVKNKPAGPVLIINSVSDTLKTKTPVVVNNEPPKPEVKVLKKGGSIWNIAKESLGENPKQGDILKLTKDIMKLNNLTMESAKHLKTNALIKMPAYVSNQMDK